MMDAHPLSKLIPEMPPEQYAALVASLKRHGQILPIVIYEGMILDGRHRERACAALGLTPVREVFTGTRAEAEAFVLNANVHRRHLTTDQRRQACVAELQRNPTISDRAIAAKLGVAHDTVAKQRALQPGDIRHAVIAPTIRRNGVPTRIAEETRRAIVAELQRDPTQTNVAIGRAIGINNVTVMRVRRKLADDTPTAPPPPPPPRDKLGRRVGYVKRDNYKSKPERVAEIAALLAKGHNRQQVADELKLSIGTVKGFIGRYKINEPGGGRHARTTFDGARIVDETVNALVGMAQGLEVARAGARFTITREHAATLLAELRPALKSVNWLLSTIKEFANDDRNGSNGSNRNEASQVIAAAAERSHA